MLVSLCTDLSKLLKSSDLIKSCRMDNSTDREYLVSAITDMLEKNKALHRYLDVRDKERLISNMLSAEELVIAQSTFGTCDILSVYANGNKVYIDVGKDV